MRLESVRAFGVLALLAGAAVAQAQQAPAHHYWYVHQETAKPSMLAQWNSTTVEVMTLGVKAKAPTMSKGIVLEGDDLNFTFAFPTPDLAGAEAINADFALMQKTNPTGFADLLKRGWAPVEAVREFVLDEQPDLSYTPAHPAFDIKDARFYHYDVYYVMPGHDDEAAALAKDFRALFQAKGITHPYRIFTVVTGPDMPALIVESPAKSAADFYGFQATDLAALGDAGKALFERAFAITRRIERKNMTLRPDLSPPMWPQAAK
jgi:hypothetical protein